MFKLNNVSAVMRDAPKPSPLWHSKPTTTPAQLRIPSFAWQEVYYSTR